MSMGGKGPEMLVTLTTDFGKVLDGMHRTRIRGSMHLATGIQIAGLALKHRQNKSQRQRIIIFTCSEIKEEKAALVKLAKKIRKESIAVDLIAFGDLSSENVAKLEAFNENVKSQGGEGSHLAIIHPGPSLLSDQLVSTPILAGENAGVGSGGDADMGGTGGGADAGTGFEFGVDPSADPELALALRMSMEEEKARQEKQKKEDEEKNKGKMEGIPEEQQPLLDQSGEASGSGDATGESSKEPDGKGDGKGDGGESMDTT